MAKRITIDEALRRAIRESGLSAFQLERDSGVSRPQITRFLNHERGLTLVAADRLCKALGLELRKAK